MASKTVFISMGRRYREDKLDEEFLRKVMELVTQCGLIPKIMDYTPQDTLKELAEIIIDCGGVIVIGHERKFVKEGMEMQKKPLFDVRYSTPWNQIEGSIARFLGIPILLLLEDRLTAEGVFEAIGRRYFKFSDEPIKDQVLASILHFCDEVKSNKRERLIPDVIGVEITVSQGIQLVKKFTVGLAALAITVLTVVFGLGSASVRLEFCGWSGFFHECQSTTSPGNQPSPPPPQ